jgi:hypothetical protein
MYLRIPSDLLDSLRRFATQISLPKTSASYSESLLMADCLDSSLNPGPASKSYNSITVLHLNVEELAPFEKRFG